MEGAITRWIGESNVRFVPIRLDTTPLPTLLKSIKYIDGNDGNHIIQVNLSFLTERPAL
jgi:hypothetical protein